MQKGEEKIGVRLARGMSDRMRDALEDIANGLTLKESAAKRFVAVDTMKTHRSKLLAYLHARTAAHAVAIAARSGLLETRVIEVERENRT